MNEKRPVTLLVVDDRTDNLIVLQQLFAEYLPGCTVITATRAAEVVDLARRTRLDAAIIDLEMPGIDGIELCRRLKSRATASYLPVMLISSHSPRSSVRASGLEAGADDFVVRPIDNLELIARVEVMLRIRHAEESLRQVNGRLGELVEERTAELRQAMEQQAVLSRRVLLAQEEERARISRGIHDGLGQILTMIHLELDLQQHALGEGHAASLGKAMEMVRRAADEARRVCRQLRPVLLDQLGLEAAVRHLCGELERQLGIDIEVAMELREPAALPSELALCAFRILQEALNNIARHAAARRVHVALEERGRELCLSVADDGRGFQPGDPAHSGGNGLAGMSERARLVGGSLEITSHPGDGTRVAFRAPLERRTARETGAIEVVAANA